MAPRRPARIKQPPRSKSWARQRHSPHNPAHFDAIRPPAWIAYCLRRVQALNIAQELSRLLEEGREFTAATIVGISSAPPGPGAALIMDRDGNATRSTSGGRAEGSVSYLCVRPPRRGLPPDGATKAAKAPEDREPTDDARVKAVTPPDRAPSSCPSDRNAPAERRGGSAVIGGQRVPLASTVMALDVVEGVGPVIIRLPRFRNTPWRRFDRQTNQGRVRCRMPSRQLVTRRSEHG
ncbi:XdhC family protein [Streptomyces canus]|uniref:XdhC family protein n=1 Tax=Streptomyces canus TaxID=58343 RepID=UPI0009A0C81E